MGKKIKEQKGIALVTVILMLMGLTVLGIIAVNATNVGQWITRNNKTSKQAFYLAEAGVETARELLRTQLAGGTSLFTMLATAANGETLNNSTTNPSFSGSNNTPFVTSTKLGTGSFKVYLTNNAVDGVTSTTDTDGIVTLTSFGYGPDNSLAIVQVTVLKSGGINLPNLPGAVTLAGPNVVFNAPDSSAFKVNGGDSNPAIAVNSDTSYNTITTDKTVKKTASNYIGTGGSPSVQNLDFNPPWDVISSLDNLYTGLKNGADYTSANDPGFYLGDTTNRKVVVIDGSYTLNAATPGAGILLVTGQLTLHGAFNYDGVILVIGTGNILRNGGGNGTITGGIYVANIKGADHQIDTPDDTFVSVTYDTTGGGNSTITYNANSQTQSANLTNSFPFIKKSWKQINP